VERVVLLLPLLALAVLVDILTGIFGAPGVVATMIASRAMSTRKALILSTVAQFIGPFVFGIAAAKVLGSQVIDTSRITPLVLYTALGATITWLVFSFYLRIPSSTTHAMLGGLIGAVFVAVGPSAILSAGLLKVMISLILSPLIGALGGFLMVRVCYWLARGSTPNVNNRFNQGQLVTSFGLGLAIGSINAQITMGVIGLGLVLIGYTPNFEIPTWVILLSAAGLAFGNLIGGLRLVRSIGARFFQVRPIHGFSAELASALIIAVSSVIGGNVSTTHVTSLSVVGAGAAERLSMVRWGFVQNVLVTWLLTIPMTALLSGLIYLTLSRIGAL